MWRWIFIRWALSQHPEWFADDRPSQNRELYLTVMHSGITLVPPSGFSQLLNCWKAGVISECSYHPHVYQNFMMFSAVAPSSP
jgi:hypothetical protein